jgi:uncharacterized protein
VCAVAHYLNGGIRVQGAAQRVTPQVKAHLSVLLGLLALLRAGGYYLNRYELTLSNRGAVDGATYTDVNAQLPALNLLVLISLVAFVLLIINIWRRGWILPLLAVGTWGVIAILVGAIIPAFIQRFTVEPSESSRERPYIERNIEATRQALNLANVTSRPFAATDDLTVDDLEANAETIRNIRLWDPSQLVRVYQRLQEFRPYYRIGDVDVDRYEIDGELRQMLISTRELDTAGVPQDSWEARHLTYTHGYGTIMAAANSKTRSGGPELVQRDIPVRAPADIEIEQPGVYFGEDLSGYVVIETDRAEIDFQDDDGTEFTTYDGPDGIGIGGIVRRSAFALRFWDFNVLISGNIRDESRILIIRDVKERVRALAPFLHFDADPYPVVREGRVRWIIDGYTTTNRYPYAQRAERGQMPAGSGLDHEFNYARNSVKAVVDAYDGTVDFYVVDPDDPIVNAYRSAFPDLFSDLADVPDGLEEHFRYPEDLFRIQTNMWGRYHIDDPDDFYNQNDAWNVAQDPEAGEGGATTQALDPQGRPVGRPREARIDPYYLLMRLPGEEQTEFMIFRPFVPVSGDDSRKEMTAFMVAKSDPDSYGELVTYVMPRNNLPVGPGLAQASINADPIVAERQTLEGREGSNVRFGNLILVPIEQSLLYVQPFYVEATSTRVPELRRVIVYFNDQVIIEETLQLALTRIFGDAPETGEDVSGPTDPDGEDPAEEDPEVAIAELVERALDAFQRADEALAARDLAAYQRLVDEARGYLEEARRRAGEGEEDEVPPEGGEGGDGEGEGDGATTTEPEQA